MPRAVRRLTKDKDSYRAFYESYEWMSAATGFDCRDALSKPFFVSAAERFLVPPRLVEYGQPTPICFPFLVVFPLERGGPLVIPGLKFPLFSLFNGLSSFPFWYVRYLLPLFPFNFTFGIWNIYSAILLYICISCMPSNIGERITIA